ncbi:MULTISPECIES: hypothetical protein [Pseudonocardia]|uniref:Uncharacterized protein n=2 Tax=Pseudonocardia TaxID=1847 RepID=A0A1Y2MUY2_PSEAH|nr:MULTISPECIES: hypothetical protein [Pseudonocardia]OSY38458.1 hypothetical protein BG845_03974 [Pseudonocardia autotrophica]TDN77099.1 hypothetical protein C8E95_6323 [Pseudonocardia autotrophica]BBG01105.1 hypothetical protein Pdca_23140 [Pseudonocardia autotrophica]GEC28798.1 hypothetical protein PSA01_58270 [Pseudonocardia saturnea]
MAIQPDTAVDGGVPGGPRWDEVFTPSDLGSGVFDVRWDLRPRLRRWLAAQNLPTASGREAHRPAVDAWAMLDGGVIAVSAVTLPGTGASSPAPAALLLGPGMRVIGYRTLRLLIDRLELPGPEQPLAGEHLDVPGLVADLFDTRRHDAAAIEQVELLASCTDRSTLRWVVTALRV